jgi:acyl dehydratase
VFAVSLESKTCGSEARLNKKKRISLSHSHIVDKLSASTTRKGAMSLSQSVREMVGKSVSIPVAYNKKDLIIYAVGIGCEEEQFVYEKNKAFQMFPTFPVSLFFKGDSTDAHNMQVNPIVVETNPPFLAPGTGGRKRFGVRSMLDGERYIECVEPLPVNGGSFVFNNKHTAIIRKGNKGIVSEYETTMEDPVAAKVFYRFWSCYYSGGAIPAFDSAGTSRSVTNLQVPTRDPDARVVFKTQTNMNLMYRLTGDFNDVHVDSALAQGLGYDRPILHGLAFLGVASRAVLKTFGGNAAEAFKAMRVRFSKPVLPGQTLETQMWLVGGDGGDGGGGDGLQRVAFQVICQETHQPCISNAYMDLKLEHFVVSEEAKHTAKGRL